MKHKLLAIVAAFLLLSAASADTVKIGEYRASDGAFIAVYAHNGATVRVYFAGKHLVHTVLTELNKEQALALRAKFESLKRQPIDLMSMGERKKSAGTFMSVGADIDFSINTGNQFAQLNGAAMHVRSTLGVDHILFMGITDRALTILTGLLDEAIAELSH